MCSIGHQIPSVRLERVQPLTVNRKFVLVDSHGMTGALAGDKIPAVLAPRNSALSASDYSRCQCHYFAPGSFSPFPSFAKKPSNAYRAAITM